mmetsp:Transcript_36954/g.79814  ORF Transcript_36954/g.79814 Transcript_36954/m.79814 type:complete len:323 (+) Transcript_36954:45-1013(+)
MSPIDTLLSEDNATVAQSLSIMMKKEQTIYTSSDYLHSPHPSSSQSLSPDETSTRIVTPSDRMMMVDWCYSIIDLVQLNRETVELAMDMVDRFLSKPSSVVITSRALYDRRQYQLIVVTALYIAVKKIEPAHIVNAMNSQLFSDVSQGMYSVQDIEHMEITILQGLDWRVCAPTSIQMANHILSLVLPHFANTMDDVTSAFVLDEVRFQTELAVRDYYFAMQRPSTVAVAAIFNALDQVDNSRTSEDCHLALFAFLIANGEFACHEDLLAATNRLYCLVENNDCLPNVNGNSDDDDNTDVSTQVSEASIETKICSSKVLTCK